MNVLLLDQEIVVGSKAVLDVSFNATFGKVNINVGTGFFHFS